MTCTAFFEPIRAKSDLIIDVIEPSHRFLDFEVIFFGVLKETFISGTKVEPD